MSTMESRDGDKTCLVEQTTTLIVDGAVAARRKRMEIRRFKKVSGAPMSSKTLNLVHQGAFKRTRSLRTSSICSLCYDGDVGEGGFDSMGISGSSLTDESPIRIVAEIDTKGTMLGGGGLVRSKSFPPECLHSSRCILDITKTGHNSVAMDVKEHYTAVVSEEYGSVVREKSSELCSWNTEATSKTGLARGLRTKETGREQSIVQRSTASAEGVDTGKEQLILGSLPGGLISGTSLANMVARPMGDIIPSPHPVESMNPVHNKHVGKPGSNVTEQDVNMSESSGRTTLDNKGGELSEFCPSSSSLCGIFCSPTLGQCPSNGKVLVCGRRREMEDTAVIAPSFTQLSSNGMAESSFDLHFFAVYDGHGGSQASNYCAKRFHHALIEELATSSLSEDAKDVSEWKKAMSSCFSKMDREVGGVCPNGACDDVDSTATCCANTIAPENVGTTAVVAVFSPFQIVVANCGDSRAVLSRGGVAIPLSKDHKPEIDDETSRIEAAGGKVIYWDGYRVAGLLALSRSIGDRYLKHYVISEPEVTCIPRTEDDECLILASDGLWDVISNQTACDVARRCLASAYRRAEYRSPDTAAASVAALLVKLAYGRGSKDNISVVVIDLKSRGA